MGENARDGAQWLPNALPLSKLHSCGNHECLEPWLEKKKNTKLGPYDTIGKVLKCKYLKCSRIVHLDLICMSYVKRKAEIKLKIWFPTTNSLKTKVKWILIGACYTSLERSSWNKKDMSVQNSKTTRVLILGLPLGSAEEKWHLDVVPMERHRVYNREGSGASSQRLLAM
jgi:hypothetical protein